MKAPYIFERVKCVYVVDGDTLDIEVDLGFSVKVTHRFRLLGVNTPERGKPGYTEAKAFLQTSVDAGISHIEVTKVEKYGRYLVTVFVAGLVPDVSVNERLVELGLAVRYMV